EMVVPPFCWTGGASARDVPDHPLRATRSTASGVTVQLSCLCEDLHPVREEGIIHSKPLRIRRPGLLLRFLYGSLGATESRPEQPVALEDGQDLEDLRSRGR